MAPYKMLHEKRYGNEFRDPACEQYYEILLIHDLHPFYFTYLPISNPTMHSDAFLHDLFFNDALKRKSGTKPQRPQENAQVCYPGALPVCEGNCSSECTPDEDFLKILP